jgi:hypothetical protein
MGQNWSKKKKVGRKSSVEKVLPYQTFLREGIPMIIIVHGSILAPSSNNWAALVGGHG